MECRREGLREETRNLPHISDASRALPHVLSGRCSVDPSSEESIFDVLRSKRTLRFLSSLSRKPSPEDFRDLPLEASFRRAGATAEERRGMSSEQNKAIVRRALEEPWQGSLKVVDD
jgi:hypothetical protein